VLGVIRPEQGPIGHVVPYMTASEVLLIKPNAQELQDEVASLPPEGLIRMCSYLLHVLHEGPRRGIDPQALAIDVGDRKQVSAASLRGNSSRHADDLWIRDSPAMRRDNLG
jgi:hypothetical protein